MLNGTASHKLFDLLSLLQCAPQLENKELGQVVLLRAVQQIPPAVSSCQTKELCNLCLVLAKLDPSVFSGDVLKLIIGSVRQKVFSLSDTNDSARSVFYPHESSVLVSSLSRVQEKYPAVEVPLDVVQRLCGTFTRPSQVPYIQVGHLVPFLQGLARFQVYASRHLRLSEGGGKGDFQLRRYIPELADTLDICFDRFRQVITTPSEEKEGGKPVRRGECAAILSSLSDLRFSDCDRLFDLVESILKEGDTSGSTQESYLVMESLIKYIHCSLLFTETCPSVVRAKALLRLSLTQVVSDSLTTPKDVVQLLSIWRKTRAMDEQSVLEEDKMAEGETAAEVSITDELVESLPAILRRVEELAPSCNLYECGTLCLYLASFRDSTNGELRSQLEKTVGALAAAAPQIIETSTPNDKVIIDVKRALDGIHTAHVVNCDVSPLVAAISTQLASAPGKQKMSIRSGLLMVKTLLKTVEQHPSPSVVSQVCLAASAVINRSVEVLDASDVNHKSTEEAVALCFTCSQLYRLTAHSDTSPEEEEGDEKESGPLLEEETPSFVATLRESLCNLLEVTGDFVLELLESGEDNQGSSVSGKTIVMLLQSIDLSTYSPSHLLSHLIPRLQHISSTLDPLEVSLLLNKLAKIGFVNSRILSTIAGETLFHKVDGCSLKECYSMLRSLQRSGYVRKDAVVQTSAVKSDWISDAPAEEGPFDILTQKLMARLEEFSTTVDDDTCTLEDLVNTARSLAFFKYPPRPLFDTFCAMAVRRFVLYVSACTVKEKLHHVSERELHHLRDLGIQLLNTILLLDKFARQASCSRALVRSMQKLESVAYDKDVRLYSMQSALRLTRVYSTAQRHSLVFDQHLLYLPEKKMESGALMELCSNLTTLLEARRAEDAQKALQHLQGSVGVAPVPYHSCHLLLLVKEVTVFVVDRLKEPQTPLLLKLSLASLISRTLLCFANGDNQQGIETYLNSLTDDAKKKLEDKLTESFSDFMKTHSASEEDTLCQSLREQLLTILQSMTPTDAALKGLSSHHLSQLFLSACVAECYTEDELFTDAEWESIVHCLQGFSGKRLWSLPDCVNVLLGAAFQDELITAINKRNENDESEEELALESGIHQCALLALDDLERHFGGQEATAATLHEMYRLLTANKGSFVRWAVREFELNNETKADPAPVIGSRLVNSVTSALLMLVRCEENDRNVPHFGETALKGVITSVERTVRDSKDRTQLDRIREILDFFRSRPTSQ
ncbi:hypothetical protein AGDE_14245 [Angomonas deanei]|uniref:Uncharacterized protein n=1 Tax=Angomonas deanei TaxID=59799 RepID=A0A7G2C582_9TRYP|nr:hypothetical protein AGDE_14245 [Angomonas deanei]CAD2214301.1 hypothetical protein, conserved [Angomonas deanei]|eukprot:EPY21175.1 hypothetical protein AGDE_14245 [Angomonas deanei]